MVSLKEMLQPQKALSKLGAINFPVSINKDNVRNPHYEMDVSMGLYETRPMINSGMKQLARFIVGGKVSFQCEDKTTHDFLNKWLDQRPNLSVEITNGVICGLVTGNVYSQVMYKEGANGAPIFDNLYNIDDPSRVYINVPGRQSDVDEKSAWLYEVPIELRSFFYQGDYKTPQFWKVNYVYSSYMFSKQVWAIPIEKNTLRHLKLGWSRNGLYGRSFLASTIDNGEVLTEIIKNYAVIARYKALGRKIIQLGSLEDPANPEDMDKLQLDLRAISDEDNIIINKPFKTEPLNFTGENDPMTAEVDFLRRDIGSGILPNYLTPWSTEVNRSTAAEAKIPFALEIAAYQGQLIDYYSRIIVGELKKSYPWLNENAKIVFDYVDLEVKSEKMSYVGTMYSANAITLNEYRKIAGLETITGGDVFASDISRQTGMEIQGMKKMSEFYKTLNMPEGWRKLSPSSVQSLSYGTKYEVREEKVRGRTGEEQIGFVVYQNGHEYATYYDFEDAMYEVWMQMNKQSAGTTPLSIALPPTMSEQAKVDNDDEKWFSGMYRRGLLTKNNGTLIRRFNIAGRALRIVKSAEGLLIFDGIQLMKQFEEDERDVANVYFEKLKEKRTAALNEFFEEVLPEDKIIDAAYDEIKRANAAIIDEIFKELPENKIKLESLKKRMLKEQAGLSPLILPRIGNIFDRFNFNLSDIVSRATKDLFGIAVQPSSLGKDVTADEAIQQKMKDTAAVIESRVTNQLKTMNGEMQNDIFRMMSDGIATGQPIGDIKQQIKDKYSSYKTKENPQDWKIGRVMRTELSNATITLKLKKWKEMGFEKIEHLTMIDDKTGVKDKEFNHRIFEIDYLLSHVEDRVPLHPNCRCTYVPYE